MKWIHVSTYGRCTRSFLKQEIGAHAVKSSLCKTLQLSTSFPQKTLNIATENSMRDHLSGLLSSNINIINVEVKCFIFQISRLTCGLRSVNIGLARADWVDLYALYITWTWNAARRHSLAAVCCATVQSLISDACQFSVKNLKHWQTLKHAMKALNETLTYNYSISPEGQPWVMCRILRSQASNKTVLL